MAIHSSYEHKSTKRSSSQNSPFVHHETRKGDTFETSIKTLKDAKETITKDSNKETEFDDHEQPVDPIDDTPKEMEVLVTRPSKFDVFINVVHTSLNANLTKDLDD
ncbi:hypothetical protein ACH5RR_032541 [Cinchona calisaya]|uniref:Uncharacterized protein n=1 Tax=Cinchona calisaya TaxID=153742 RepID=A0ABD2YMI7_9GENT